MAHVIVVRRAMRAACGGGRFDPLSDVKNSGIWSWKADLFLTWNRLTRAGGERREKD